MLGAKLTTARPGSLFNSIRPVGPETLGEEGRVSWGAVGQTALPLWPRMGQTPGPPPPGPGSAVRGGGDGTESLGWTHVPLPDSFGSRPGQCAKPF